MRGRFGAVAALLLTLSAIGLTPARAGESSFVSCENRSNPSAAFSRAPNGDVQPGTVVTFDGSASRPADGLPLRDYRWDFGDGHQAAGAVVSHAFAESGVYMVRLTVHDQDGSGGGTKSAINVGATYTNLTSQDVFIASQGFQLHGVVTRPAASGRFPVIVEYGPYPPVPFSESREWILEESGYAILHVEGPGRGASGGHWDQFGPVVERGGYDVIEWAAKQAWSTGKVGLMGYSGPAVAALLTAGSRPPHLAAVVARNSYSDFYRDLIYPGGIRNSLTFAEFWTAFFLGGQDTAYTLNPSSPNPQLFAQRWQDYAGLMATMQEHPFYDSYWQQRKITANPVSAPVLYVGSEHDLWPRSSMEIARWVIPAGGKVVLTPGGHSTPDPSGWESGGFSDGEARAWFDHYLKGYDNRVQTRPAISAYVEPGGDAAASCGDNGSWVTFRSWPPKGITYSRLYLSGTPDGAEPESHSLAASPPAVAPGTVPTAVLYSPASGTTTDNTPNYEKPVEGLQQVDDVQAAVFETPPLASDVQVAGPLVLHLWSTLAAADVAWSIHVNDVWPDGTSHYISSGFLHADQVGTFESANSLYYKGMLVRPYYTHESSALPAPGTAAEYAIEIWPVMNTFAAGHRLRLTIAAQNAVWRVAYDSGPAALIWHDPGHPSYLLLPTLTIGSRLARHPYR